MSVYSSETHIYLHIRTSLHGVTIRTTKSKTSKLIGKFKYNFVYANFGGTYILYDTGVLYSTLHTITQHYNSTVYVCNTLSARDKKTEIKFTTELGSLKQQFSSII